MFQQYYTKKRTFEGISESNWENHAADFLENRAHYDTREHEECLFPRNSLAHLFDSRQDDSFVLLTIKGNGSHAMRKQLFDRFTALHVSVIKQIDILNWLDALKIRYLKEKDEDHCHDLRMLAKGIN